MAAAVEDVPECVILKGPAAFQQHQQQQQQQQQEDDDGSKFLPPSNAPSASSSPSSSPSSSSSSNNNNEYEYLEGFEVVVAMDDDTTTTTTTSSSGGSMGRVSIATKNFNVDDTVLIETPILVVDPNHPLRYQGMIESYYTKIVSSKDGDDDAIIKSAIMDMYCLDDNNDEKEMHDNNQQQEQEQQDFLLQQRMEMLKEDWEQWSSYQQQQQQQQQQEDPLKKKKKKKKDMIVTLEDCMKLLRIIDANAHCFYNPTTADSASGSKNTSDHLLLALFVKGSKVEHSCTPNLSHSITRKNGQLQYKAIRPIQKGERLSISYGKINKLLLQPDDDDHHGYYYSRLQRQEFLFENKFFHCRCTRCLLGPDECNPYYIHCNQCDNNNKNHSNNQQQERKRSLSSLACSYQVDSGGLLVWRCIRCQSEILDLQRIEKQQQVEAKYDERLNLLLEHWKQHQQQQQPELLQADYANADNKNATMTIISTLIETLNEISNELPPFHWINIKGYRLLSSMTQKEAAAALHHHHHQQQQEERVVTTTTTKDNDIHSVEQANSNKNNIPMIVQMYHCLSTLALLLQARWVLRMGRIIYGDIPLEHQQQQCEDDDKKMYMIPSLPNYPQQQLELSVDQSLVDIIENLSDDLCKEFESIIVANEEGTSTAAAAIAVVDEIADPIFHAGQHWLLLSLTGGEDHWDASGSGSGSTSTQQQQVAKLYDTFLPVFQRWDHQLSNHHENYNQRVLVLVQNHGK